MKSRFVDDLSFHDWREKHRVRRGHGVHILLAVLGLAMALGLFLAHSTGVLDARASMLIVLSLGLLALPLIFMDPVHGIVVYAMMAPISLEFTIAERALRVHDPLAVLILAGVVIQMAKSSRPMPKLRGKRILFLYAGFGMFATVLGMILQANGREPDIFHALKVIQYVVIAMAAGLSIRSKRDLRLVVGGVLAGLILLAGQLYFEQTDRHDRVTGAMVDEQANVLSVYLAVAASVVLGSIDRVKDKMLVALLCGLMLLAGFIMLKTQSRTGYASFGVVVFVALFTMRRKIIPIGLALAGAMTFAFRPDLFARVKTIGAAVGIGKDSSFEARKIAYNLIWGNTSQHPSTLLFGEGRGAETLSYADTQWGIELLYGGILGVLICAGLVLASIWLAYKVWKATRHRVDAVGAASMAGFLGLIAAGVATFGMTSFSSIRLAEAVFILIGVVMATDRLVRNEERRLDSLVSNGKERDEKPKSKDEPPADDSPRVFDY